MIYVERGEGHPVDALPFFYKEKLVLNFSSYKLKTLNRR
jgi:hypothetical protein